MKEEHAKAKAKAKAKAVAAEVFASCRNQIYFQLRYMEHALFYLKPEECTNVRMGSDGRKLYYEINYLLKRYLQSPDAVACDYLHTVFHCLYQHPLQAKEYDRRYWDLAADIAVTDVMGELRLKRMEGEIPLRCYVITEHLKKEVPLMSAPHIARYLMMEEAGLEKLFGLSLQEMQELFARDDHSCWSYRTKKRTEENEEKQGGKEGQNSAGRANAGKYRHGNQAAGQMSTARWGTDKKEAVNGEEDKPGEEQKAQEIREEQNAQEGQEERAAPDSLKTLKNRAAQDNGETQETPEDPASWENPDSQEEPSDQENPNSPENPEALEAPFDVGDFGAQLSQDWLEIAETVMLSAQSFAKEQGDLPGSMVQTLQRLTRESYDYTDFLKKFATLEECMKLNLDEFDYLYYLYGLKRFGRIALIEPLEYKEEYLVREFVIAIDTSGSCSGELVQKFLNKTYNILKSTESFSRKVVIHVIQCDCAIQEDTVIESLEDLDHYTEHLEIKGLGGTDFRPVFTYVEELCAKKAFRDLRGLIYFTDGYGTFPERPPKYKTAFVFVNREDQVQVPPWAMRMYLDEDSIEDHKKRM